MKYQIEEIIGEKIESESGLGGGCIGNASRIKTESGKHYFVKTYSGAGASILQNEANGLKELAKADAIKIPCVIAVTDNFLLLEFIETGRKPRNFSEVFGRQFARLHKYTSDNFGFYEDNFIGSNPQKNTPQKENWKEFYWENRLIYQYKLAEHKGNTTIELRSAMSRLENKIDEILNGTEEKPSLLHGDLWGGNYIVSEKGEPVLIDPAVYYGHREADIGMTCLFGGFDQSFYRAYNEEFPLPDEWEYRIDLYKLYHVLNHLNLFGSGYYNQALHILNKYTR